MINKTDISKFSFAEATSNSNGKTSGSKVAGFIVVITSCICISACTVYSILGGASGLSLAGIFSGLIIAGLTLFGYSKSKGTRDTTNTKDTDE